MAKTQTGSRMRFWRWGRRGVGKARQANDSIKPHAAATRALTPSGIDRARVERASESSRAQTGSTQLAPLNDAQLGQARVALPRPSGPSPRRSGFGRAGGPPDAYNSLSVECRNAIAPASTLVPGAAQRETVRRRPGTVTDTIAGKVPDQHCTASRCSASGTSATNAAPVAPAPVVRPWIAAAVRAQMDNIDPSFFKVERIIETDWPDERSSRRTKLPERANRSPREAEEREWEW